MARIRTIKPTFFTSEDVSVLPLRARLTWIGLWTHCDDTGRAKDNVRLIKAAVWPLDEVSLSDVEEDLITLADHGRIARYEVDGQRLLEVTNWSEHQKISRPTASKLPAPSLNSHAWLSEGSRQEGKGKEGKGGDMSVLAHEPNEPPPRTCPKHPNGTENPCRACGQAREAAEAWAVDQRSRVRSGAKCRNHRGQLADNCGPCRSETKGAA